MAARDLKAKGKNSKYLLFNNYNRSELLKVSQKLNLENPGQRWPKKALATAISTYVMKSCPENCMEFVVGKM